MLGNRPLHTLNALSKDRQRDRRQLTFVDRLTKELPQMLQETHPTILVPNAGTRLFLIPPIAKPTSADIQTAILSAVKNPRRWRVIPRRPAGRREDLALSSLRNAIRAA